MLLRGAASTTVFLSCLLLVQTDIRHDPKGLCEVSEDTWLKHHRCVLKWFSHPSKYNPDWQRREKEYSFLLFQSTSRKGETAFAYQHLTLVSFEDFNPLPVNLHQDPLNVGHGGIPTVFVLGLDVKVAQPGLVGADLDQGVGAAAHEVVGHFVKGVVMRVVVDAADPVGMRVAVWDAVLDSAVMIFWARVAEAPQLATSTGARASGGAGVVGPKAGAHGIMLTLVPAPTLLAGHTGAIVEEEPGVADAGFRARPIAGGRSAWVHASGWTGAGAWLVVAVECATNGCRKQADLCEVGAKGLVLKNTLHPSTELDARPSPGEGLFLDFIPCSPDPSQRSKTVALQDKPELQKACLQEAVRRYLRVALLQRERESPSPLSADPQTSPFAERFPRAQRRPRALRPQNLRQKVEFLQGSTGTPRDWQASA